MKRGAIRGPDHAVTRSCGRVSVPDRAPEAFALWNAGSTTRELADKYKVTTDMIRRWLRAVIDAGRDERNSR